MTIEKNQSNESKKTSRPAQPNKLFAPIVIAGITVGFLASAYKFVFAKPDQKKESVQSHQNAKSPVQNDD